MHNETQVDSTARIYTVIPALLQSVIYITVRTVFTVFCRLHIEGDVKKLGKHSYIYAANHVSEWDGPLIRSCLPFFSKKVSPMYFVGMREGNYDFKNFGFRSFIYRGPLFKMLGAYPTFPGKHDYATSLAWFSHILQQDKSICIFPEGKRSWVEGEFGEARGGVGYLALEEGKPVVPVAIVGLAGKTIWHILTFQTRVTVRFGNPVTFLDKEQTYADIAKEILQLIIDLHGQKKFAFLVHPRNHLDLKRKFPFLKMFPRFAIDMFAYLAPPVTVSKITGLRSKLGQPVDGYIVAITMTARQMLKQRDRALRKIIQATKFAKRKGIGVIGFGALTASLTKGGLQVMPEVPDIGITTGRIYTVKTVTDYAKKCIEDFGFDTTKVEVAIVGAGGSIGSGCFEILNRYGVNKFVLVDLARKHSGIAEAAEKMDCDVVITDDLDAIRQSDIVIAATSSPDVVIQSHHLKPGAIVINDAQPSDISPEIVDTRKDVLIIEGGVVYTEGIKCNFNLGLAGREDTFCCLGEVLILAHNKRFETFSIGYSDLSQIAILDELSKTIDISISKFQNIRGYIPQEQIDSVRSIIQSNT